MMFSKRRTTTILLSCLAGLYMYVTFSAHQKQVAQSNNKGSADKIMHQFMSLLVEGNSANENESSSDKDKNCPFKNSGLYRSIYVYEHPDIGPSHMRSPSTLNRSYGAEEMDDESLSAPKWYWLEEKEQWKEKNWGSFIVGSSMEQFSLDIIVHDIITHPDSCLRTTDPATAKLFYVPYLNSIDFHKYGKLFPSSYDTTPHAQAIMDAIDGDYSGWNNIWGLTDQFWKRRQGSDHFFTHPEPCHGFSHPRWKRGNHHFIHSQMQLKPPIMLSVELSTTFVKMYPKCAAKNILLPYPIPDGRVFNGFFVEEANQFLQSQRVNISNLSNFPEVHQRPAKMFYSGGNHGTCEHMRKSIQHDYECSPSKAFYNSLGKLSSPYGVGMRLADFCPCPGGDTPSAKRMFDAVLSGCIPVILSEDFVWPLSREFDPENKAFLDPEHFSIRLNSALFFEPKCSKENCTPVSSNDPPLHDFLSSISNEKIKSLLEGLKEARQTYSFYRFDASNPDQLMREGTLPDGGASHALLAALEERALGKKWPACLEELQNLGDNVVQPDVFKC